MLKEKLKQLKQALGVSVANEEEEDQKPVTAIIDGVEHEITSISEIIPTVDEKEQMDIEIDKGYLQYSAEVVGFENRELQWNAYRMITSYTDTESIIDFGCGRGDYVAFWKSEMNNDLLDYVGIDMNSPLINAGLEIYPDINLIQSDWFSLDNTLVRDWAINIGSSNLRYDADTTTSDIDYTKKTIDRKSVV